MHMKDKNVRRHRFNVSLNLEGHPIEVSTRFSETTRAGRAAGYLSSGEIDRRSGVEVAITCLFAPLREAQEGATEDEVEESIAISQAQWELYMDMARNRCRCGSSRRGAIVKLQPTEAQSVESVSDLSSAKPTSQLSETDPEDLDLENEVL
jgi:hypothetical protein